MLPECLMNVSQRKSSMENFRQENAPMVVRRSDTRTPSKPPLKTSTYQQSWEQTAQDRTKWRGLIQRGAGEYEAKKISEALDEPVARKLISTTTCLFSHYNSLNCFRRRSNFCLSQIISLSIKIIVNLMLRFLPSF